MRAWNFNGFLNSIAAMLRWVLDTLRGAARASIPQPELALLEYDASL